MPTNRNNVTWTWRRSGRTRHQHYGWQRFSFGKWFWGDRLYQIRETRKLRKAKRKGEKKNTFRNYFTQAALRSKRNYAKTYGQMEYVHFVHCVLHRHTIPRSANLPTNSFFSKQCQYSWTPQLICNWPCNKLLNVTIFANVLEGLLSVIFYNELRPIGKWMTLRKLISKGVVWHLLKHGDKQCTHTTQVD